MAIRQEELIETIQTAIAWEQAVKKLKEEIQLAYRVASPGEKGIIIALYQVLRNAMPEPEAMGKVHFLNERYKLRAQGNIMRRATMAGIREEQRIVREHKAKQRLAQNVNVMAELEGYVPPEGLGELTQSAVESVRSAPARFGYKPLSAYTKDSSEFVPEKPAPIRNLTEQEVAEVNRLREEKARREKEQKKTDKVLTPLTLDFEIDGIAPEDWEKILSDKGTEA